MLTTKSVDPLHRVLQVRRTLTESRVRTAIKNNRQQQDHSSSIAKLFEIESPDAWDEHEALAATPAPACRTDDSEVR